jgi:hypothetical protein
MSIPLSTESRDNSIIQVPPLQRRIEVERRDLTIAILYAEVQAHPASKAGSFTNSAIQEICANVKRRIQQRAQCAAQIDRLKQLGITK